VRREELPGDGLRLGVPAPALPRLRVEAAGRDRFWVRQGTRPLLLARIDHGHQGVHYRRLAGYEPVLPPIPAALARAAPSWPHRYASWLADGPGPLHAGWWSLKPWRPRTAEYLWRHELAADPAGYLDWMAGWQGVVTLRTPPEAEEGRVKAHRKLAREGTLPPLLLWWVSGLDGWLLLDGHARLVAALAEGIVPPALELSRAPSPAQVEEMVAITMRNESTVMAQLERDRRAGRFGVEEAARRQRRRLSGVYADIPGRRERTRAWPLPGGASAWDSAWESASESAAAPPE